MCVHDFFSTCLSVVCALLVLYSLSTFINESFNIHTCLFPYAWTHRPIHMHIFAFDINLYFPIHVHVTLHIYTHLPPSSRTFMFPQNYACVFPHSCTYFCPFMRTCFPYSHTSISLFLCIYIPTITCIYLLVPRRTAPFTYNYPSIFTCLLISIRKYIPYEKKHTHIHVPVCPFSNASTLPYSYTCVFTNLHVHAQIFTLLEVFIFPYYIHP